MTQPSTTITTSRIRSFDGTELAVHQTGEGRALLLLHGLFSSAETNWIKFGHAARLASAGFRVIMPDLRAHGASGAPHDPAAYPRDVLVDDALSLIDTLGLDDFDLGGFSLGARITAKLLAAGVTPRKAVLAGMGWEGLTGWGRRRDFFVTAIDRRDEVKRGDPHFLAVAFMKTQGIDPIAARLLLDSFGDVDTDALVNRDVPVLVVCGADDQDNGSAPELSRQLRDATYREIRGTHMSSVLEPALADEMVSFLTA
ncbi:alpha/beta fold hydrolase [Blastomonas fulva]|uniref:alpha/beta fold hydrolase n=1 Tax=Blastomonas fulva TaxID=1550728 RepID=UPI003F7292E8